MVGVKKVLLEPGESRWMEACSSAPVMNKDKDENL